MATKSRHLAANRRRKRHFRRTEDLADAIRDRLTGSTTAPVAGAVERPGSGTVHRAGPNATARDHPPSAPHETAPSNMAALPVSETAEAAWRAACGQVLPEVVDRITLIRQEDSVLVVYVQSPVWATRIRLAAPSLIKSLQAAGLAETTDLRIRVLPREHLAPEPEKRTASLTPRSAKVIDGIASRMGHSDLGDSLRRLARSRKNSEND